MVCDLHTHSYFSDGSYSPTELVFAAKQKGLCAIALTDHNTAKGLPEFLSSAKAMGVTAVAGTELSVDYGNTELHILGLFLPERAYAEIEKRVLQLKKNKEESNRILCERLRADGFEITLEEVKESSETGFVNRALIGKKLVEKGYVPSVSSAFETLLRKGGKYYIEPKRLDGLETVKFLKKLGAVVVLAHPFLNLDEEGLRGFIRLAKPLGLDGIETIYPSYTKQQTELSKQIAEEFGLLESGGSDFHGEAKPHIALGVGTGSLAVPKELFFTLQACAEGKTVYKMKLQEKPFSKIKAGKKRVELRLFDEKRQAIQVGDLIQFTKMQTQETLLVRVTGVKIFENFKKLYDFYDKGALGYEESELADPKDMEQYYPAEEIEKFGAVAIEIEAGI